MKTRILSFLIMALGLMVSTSAFAQPASGSARITSYNVCYTKLLRTSTGGTGRINGVTDSNMLHSSKWHIANLTRYQALSGNYFLGGYYSGRSYSGNMAEVLAYSGTVTDQNQIESYLAIKYGISLPSNYLASDGSIIWSTTSGYQNDRNNFV